MFKKPCLVVFIVYLLVALFLYYPTLNSFFVSDDFDWLWRAKNIPFTGENYFLKNAEGKNEGGVFRPLTNLSFWLNFKVGGLSPQGYHLFNLFLHLLNGFLLFKLILSLTPNQPASLSFQKNRLSFLNSRRVLAALAGFFFLILPNHAEAVSWISSRSDLLAAFFYLLTLLFYFNFRRKGGIWRFLISLLSFAAALLAKEMSLSLPLVILVYELLWQSDVGKRGLKTIIKKTVLLLPFVFLALNYLIWRWQATGLTFSSYNNVSSKGFSFVLAIKNLLKSLVGSFLTGQGQAMVNDWAVSHWLIMGLLLAMLFLGLGILIKKERRFYFFSSFFFLAALLPVYNLELNLLNSEGERFIYLPSLASAILLALIFWTAGKKFSSLSQRIIILGIFLTLGGFLGLGLIQKNFLWQKAGHDSQNLLNQFIKNVEPQKGEGIVIVGMPDNLEGAFIFRNGWFRALNLFEPSYQPDLLVTKATMNLLNQSSDKSPVHWQKLDDGFQGISSDYPYLFSGPPRLTSQDYLMEIKNYDKLKKAGPEIILHFTPQFLKQTTTKKIRFFVVDQKGFKEISL